MTDAAPRPVRFADLGQRVVSGVAMAAAALAVVWLGGAWVAARRGGPAAVMLWELRRIVTGDGAALAPRMLLLGGGGALAVLAAWGLNAAAGLALLYACAAAVFLTERRCARPARGRPRLSRVGDGVRCS